MDCNDGISPVPLKQCSFLGIRVRGCLGGEKQHTKPVFPTEIVDSVKTKLFERDPWDVIIVNAFKNAACEWVPLEWLEYFAILCQLRYVDQGFETNS